MNLVSKLFMQLIYGCEFQNSLCSFCLHLLHLICQLKFPLDLPIEISTIFIFIPNQNYAEGARSLIQEINAALSACSKVCVCSLMTDSN